MLHRLSLLASTLIACTTLLAGCSQEQAPLSCEDARSFLVSCTDVGQPGCGDDGRAVARIGTCGESEHADLFGNGVQGEACIWNWECKADDDFSCNHGRCFRRNTVGNRCDIGDDSDCLPELACAEDLSVPGDIDGICSETSEAVIPPLYAETIRENEEEDHADNTFRLVTIIMQTAFERMNGDDKLRRAFHSKPHTCVRGNFEVLPNIAQDMQVGPVFASPQEFPAWIRFSNGSIVMGPDDDAPLQGLAIKLMGVDGDKVLEAEQPGATTQDFLLIDLQATPTTDANEFVDLAQAQFDGTFAIAAYMLSHPSVRSRSKSLMSFQPPVESSRDRQYWAGGAYRFGTRAMKYSTRPCEGTSAAETPSGSDFLRADLTKVLQEEDVCFDFFVQIQKDSLEQSIEDGTSIWDPKLAPPQHLARVTIPSVDLESQTAMADEEACDDMSFNIWNTAPEYKPLGHINRGRRSAYEASKSTRGASPEPSAP